jgi:transcriptional regulator with XRE-family HTH domain
MTAPGFSKVNTKWFKERLAERKLSQRGLAKLMDMDPGGVSLMLRGKRHVYPAEAARVAEILRQPIDVVIEHLGVRVDPVVGGGGKRNAVPIVGKIDPRGELVEGKVSGPRHAPAAEGAGEGTVAVRVEAPGVSQDGWLLYYTPTPHVAPDIVGALCVVRVAGEKADTVGWVQKSYTPGRVILIPLLGGRDREVQLEHAARVRLAYMGV